MESNLSYTFATFTKISPFCFIQNPIRSIRPILGLVPMHLDQNCWPFPMYHEYQSHCHERHRLCHGLVNPCWKLARPNKRYRIVHSHWSIYHERYPWLQNYHHAVALCHSVLGTFYSASRKCP